MELHLKWKLTALAVLVVLAAAASGTAIRSFAQTRPEAGPAVPVVDDRYTDFASAAYILKESGGYVAVFSSNTSQPLEVTAIPVSTLRQADQTLLETGITAANEEELLQLLEDFGS